MRLTCPRCGAQYEIDETLIPAEGRSVQCSACDHVWDQPAAPRPLDPAARPVLHRPLSESVLSVLREEAAREIGARRSALDADAANDAGPAAGTGDTDRHDPAAQGTDADDNPDYSPPPLPPPDEDDGGSDLHWPATTLTHPAPPVSADILAARLESDLDATGPGADRSGAAGADTTGRDPGPPPPRRVARRIPSEDRRADPAPPNAEDRRGAVVGRPIETPRPAVRVIAPDPPDMLRADDLPAGPAVTGAAGENRGVPRRSRADDPRPDDLATDHDAPLPDPGDPTAAPPDRARPVHAAAAPRHYPAPAPNGTTRRRSYDAGFAVATIAALALVASYALAPRLADQGTVGARLMEYRQQVDQGRAWLQTRADGLISTLRR